MEPPGTRLQNFRYPPDEWAEFGAVADIMGTDRSAAIREFIRWFTRQPGADLPPRPTQEQVDHARSSLPNDRRQGTDHPATE